MYRSQTGTPLRGIAGLVVVSMLAPSPPASAAPGGAGDLRLGNTRQRQSEPGSAGGESAAEERPLDGPYYLRSADPIPLGEVELKFIYRFARDHGEGEEHEGEVEIEWGFAENWELIVDIGAELFEGRAEGNGDIEELGVHWRLWKQEGLLPAFAMRHLVRIPTGIDSDGVDYTARGIFTWDLTDTARLHFDPFLTSINGNRDEDERNFRWGAAIGFDWMLDENTTVIFDYFHQSSEEYGQRNQQSVEFGMDWEFAEDQMLAFEIEVEVDGDSYGDDFIASVSYIYEFEP